VRDPIRELAIMTDVLRAQRTCAWLSQGPLTTRSRPESGASWKVRVPIANIGPGSDPYKGPG